MRLAGGDPGDAAADPGAARGDARRARPLAGQGGRVVGLGAARRPRHRRGWTAFGDNLYNIYGSTEVAYASIATPADLRAAPGIGGQAAARHRREDPRHERAAECRRGESGRIFVGNGLLFEGYTGGGHKDMVDGLMSTGDVGRFDEDGRLYVEGRDDEMIVSGGENVFPKEVEDCLVRHEAVWRGRRGRRGRRRVRQAAARLRGASPREVSEDDLKALGEGQPGPLQGAARDRLPRRAAPQRDRQGAQAGAGRVATPGLIRRTAWDSA